MDLCHQCDHWPRLDSAPARPYTSPLMPNHKSAEKRVRQNEKRRVINRSHRTKVRTYIKKVRTALESGSAEAVQQVLPEAISVIDKSVQKGVMHANAAARYKSRLTAQANQVGK